MTLFRWIEKLLAKSPFGISQALADGHIDGLVWMMVWR
jgi:hypothetical protein